MRTAGIDLASQDKNTAACVLSWSESGATVETLTLGLADAEIVDIVGRVDKAGIDVPLGWPLAFVEAVAEHGRSGAWPSDYLHADTQAYRYRRTDLHTRSMAGGALPLSVAADRIAIPAMRAAALLSRIDPGVMLDGSGVVVEVYPAAALRIWGLPSTRYKRAANAAARDALLSRFLTTARWLTMTDQDRARCQASDDALDAVVAACVARAAALGRVHPIPAGDAEAARREGWIALPLEGSLPHLADLA